MLPAAPDGPAHDVLFVFAHQDDEIGISTRIAHEAACGHRVWCLYLTDGARSVPAHVRDAESRGVLETLGVAPERVVFLSDANGRIADGALAREAVRGRAMLETWIAAAGVRVTRVFTLDWEGGHHDHDAAHVIALAAAGGAPVYVFAFYNAYRRRRGFFRVASFVPGNAPIERRRLGARTAWAAAVRVLSYPSQRRTWAGLGPGFVARMLVRRDERFRAAEPARIEQRPHDGPLLYEVMFAVDADDVLAWCAPLRAAIAAALRTS